jgi:hypothetical protein
MIDARLRLFIPPRAVSVPLPVAGDVGFDGNNRSFSYGEGTARAEVWIDVDHSPATVAPSPLNASGDAIASGSLGSFRSTREPQREDSPFRTGDRPRQ